MDILFASRLAQVQVDSLNWSTATTQEKNGETLETYAKLQYVYFIGTLLTMKAAIVNAWLSRDQLPDYSAFSYAASYV